MIKNIVFTFIISLSIFHYHNSYSSQLSRPPQYVLVAFDGSLNLDMWKETLTFAKKNNIKLTYFLSGVYFLLDSNRMDYIEPTKGAGKSAIGFAGDSKENLIERVKYVNNAFDDGHTIGSHANGHYDGLLWPLSAWESEFKEFNHLIFDVYKQKGMQPQPGSDLNPYHFSTNQVIGFRSPLLSTNSQLYKVLQQNNFSFDTSQTSPMNYWPRKSGKLWNFPLAEVRIFGTGIKTLSMDYNFYYVQSGGNPDLNNAERYHQEMLNTYMAYFYTNYYGNRAPVHIGHHFSKWNNGAYWNALQDFVKSVCTKPEVKCVSYQSLLNYMNSLTPEMITDYQKGNFPKVKIPPRKQIEIASVSQIDIDLSMNQSDDDIEVFIKGKHSSMFISDKNYFSWKFNNKEILRTKNSKIKMSSIPRFKNRAKLTVLLKINGKEMLRSSHYIYNLDDEKLRLSEIDLEKRASLGDLPEAHKE